MFEQRDTSKDIESILNDMHDTHEFDDDDLLRELEETFADDDDGTGLPISDSEVAVSINTPASATDTNRNDDDSSAGTPLTDIVFPVVPTNPLPINVDATKNRSSPENEERICVSLQAKA